MRTLLALSLLAIAPDAWAQHGFVQGGIGREVKRFSSDEDRSVFDGTVNAVWFGASGFLVPQVSVGLEVDLGGESSSSETISVVISGRPTQITTTYSSRRRSMTALAGLHTPSGRAVRLGCYAGLSFSAVRRTIGSDAPAIVLQDPSPPSVSNELITSVLVGVDVAINVLPSVAIVAAVRAHGLSLTGDLAGFSIRPGIGARVSF